jgi:hypothetical protein
MLVVRDAAEMAVASAQKNITARIVPSHQHPVKDLTLYLSTERCVSRAKRRPSALVTLRNDFVMLRITAFDTSSRRRVATMALCRR